MHAATLCTLALAAAANTDDQSAAASWRRTSGGQREAAVLFSEPSELDGSMRVEVRERAEGWRTMHLVGDRREIMHGVSKFDAHGALEPSAVPSEYLLSMAALALAGLERSGGGGEEAGDEAPRFLFLGLGAGVLPKLLAHHVPRSVLCALEPDATCVRAAAAHLGLDTQRVGIVGADAAGWVAAEAAQSVGARREPDGWDAIFVDVFDETNAAPIAFREPRFAAALRAVLSPRGVVVANLHVGSKPLASELRAAEVAYAGGFPQGVRRFASLDSKPWAGNVLLAAGARSASFGDGADDAALRDAAAAAHARWRLRFDVAARCGGGVRVT